MDPLFYGTVTIGEEDKVSFESGNKVISELETLVHANKPIRNVIQGSHDVMNHFHQLFPEVTKSNETGKLTSESFSLWEPSQNEINVELDTNSETNTLEQKFDVYVGGPACACAAALQASSGDSAYQIVYAHDGRRAASNWKGSASYYHIRDSVPVYYWPDNHGVYTLYSTCKHFVQRKLMPGVYMKDIATDPNWNKLRLNVTNFLKEPSISWLFLKNQYYAMQDVGLHIQGTQLRDNSKQTANATCRLASLTPHILKNIESKRPLLLQSNENIGDAIYTFSGSDKAVEDTENVINSLSSIAGDELLEHNFLSKEEISSRGYDANHVKKAAIFPKDGNFPPYLDEEYENIVIDKGGNVMNNMQLNKILVRPNHNDDDVAVSKIVWKDTQSGEEHSTAINSLYLSLGPSMKSMKVKLPLQYASLSTKLNGIFGGNNLIGKIMWASASSIVFMVRVDCSLVGDESLRCLRDHIDGHNKHIIRLAEKDVTIREKKFKYFVLQSTGGGHFPSRYVHAETALNLIKANIIPILGLERKGIEYDILQVRSCARGVTAQNAFRMSAPASNFVMVYGLGGIGMSTMAGNALLMKALMGMRQKVSNNELDSKEFQNSLRTSSFGNNIIHWSKKNPFNENYAQFVDSVNNPKQLAKHLGVSKSLPLLQRASMAFLQLLIKNRFLKR